MAEKVKSAEKHTRSDAEKSHNSRSSTWVTAPVVPQADGRLGFQRTAGNLAVQRVLRSGAIQAKLRVNRPGDRYEEEADRLAEQVMRMPVPAVQRACACGGTCPECGDQDVPAVQRKSEAPGAATAVPSQHSVVPSGGRAMEQGTRSFFEGRFGMDFSQVRIHAGSRASGLAHSLQARAYTVGRDVVFGEGQYQPHSEAGRLLLAHELTHVVQQGTSRVGKAGTRARPDIQRLEEDFRISGLTRERDESKVFFELGQADIPTSQYAKIQALAHPTHRNLTLFGYASEEGAPAVNAQLVNRRIAGVSQALHRAGHRASRTPRPRPEGGVGQIEYRNLRAVEVVPTPAPVGGVPQEPDSSVNVCDGPSPEPSRCGTVLIPCTNAPAWQTDCGTAFNDVFPTAATMVFTAAGKLNSSDPPVVTEANNLLATLFPGVDRDKVVENISRIMVHVMFLPFQHRCHNECDPGCGRPAYNNGTGVGSSGAVMTLCPGFLQRSDQTANAVTLIHEAIHGTEGVATRDLGYRSSRLIASMTGADALQNTDSYVLLIRLLHSPGSVTIGPPPSQRDEMLGLDPATEEPAARRAVAYLEAWLNYADFDTGLIYGAVTRSVPPATEWSTAGSDGPHNIPKLHLIAPLFGLTDPGASEPFDNSHLPTDEDKHKLAAIHDRYDRMYDSVRRTKLTIRKGGPGDDEWSAGGTSRRLLLARAVTVGPDFFALNSVQQVKHLVRLMARGLPDVSAAYENAYAEAADHLRQRRTLGP